MEKIKIVGGNVKLGSMGTFSKLYGNQAHVSKKYGSMVGSCGKYCESCKQQCYVAKSYRYNTVIDNHAKNTLAFREDIEKAFKQLELQLSRKRKPFEVIRINQSGELETAQEFCNWCELAKKNPNTDFYIYTKAFDLVMDILLTGLTPSNITVLISVWHEYGIQEFNALKHLSNVKAFVYQDGFDYDAIGLHIQTYCHAYDKNGKLDHSITCDKCKKCFNNLPSCKVVGCYSH